MVTQSSASARFELSTSFYRILRQLKQALILLQVFSRELPHNDCLCGALMSNKTLPNFFSISLDFFFLYLQKKKIGCITYVLPTLVKQLIDYLPGLHLSSSNNLPTSQFFQMSKISHSRSIVRIYLSRVVHFLNKSHRTCADTILDIQPQTQK